jgi:hypothetical protein
VTSTTSTSSSTRDIFSLPSTLTPNARTQHSLPLYTIEEHTLMQAETTQSTTFRKRYQLVKSAFYGNDLTLSSSSSSGQQCLVCQVSSREYLGRVYLFYCLVHNFSELIA